MPHIMPHRDKVHSCDQGNLSQGIDKKNQEIGCFNLFNTQFIKKQNASKLQQNHKQGIFWIKQLIYGFTIAPSFYAVFF